MWYWNQPRENAHQEKSKLWGTKDRGHNGCRLAKFAGLEIATKAGLKLAH
jgi:hypothetical protein